MVKEGKESWMDARDMEKDTAGNLGMYEIGLWKLL